MCVYKDIFTPLSFSKISFMLSCLALAWDLANACAVPPSPIVPIWIPYLPLFKQTKRDFEKKNFRLL